MSRRSATGGANLQSAPATERVGGERRALRARGSSAVVRRSIRLPSRFPGVRLNKPIVLRGAIPGGLMFQLPVPPGLPPHDQPPPGQIHAALRSPTFGHITEAERRATIGSLSRTYARSAYHESRLWSLRKALDTRRLGLPGEVTWDSTTEFVHVELQAFAGAARMLVDELVYLVARRHPVEVLLDPVPDADWSDIRASHHVRLSISEFLNTGNHLPLSIPLTALDRIWTWRENDVHDWVH
jgi:hypothetical protein